MHILLGLIYVDTEVPLVTSSFPSCEPVKDKSDKDPRGKDVTDAFPLARKEGLKVYRNGKWCSVYEDGDEKPINESGIQKKDVVAFLEKYVGE